MNKMFVSLILVFSFSNLALAGVKVTSVDLRTTGANGYVNITLDGRSNELPDVKVKGKMIEITLSGANAFNAIFKNVQGAQLSANALNGKAIVKAILPYEIAADQVELGWKDANIEVSFPRGKATKTVYQGTGTSTKEVIAPKATAPAALDKKDENKISKDILNEDYLNSLMNEDVKIKKSTEAAPINEMKKDEVNVKLASPIKAPAPATTKVTKILSRSSSSSDNFSFAGYAAKFTLFLALVLGLFYGIVQLLKKGVFNRGKLGFLNNTKMIEVLSTTYVSPKRSIMIVKAHNQIFLVANAENGLTFLSEMKDTSGLIKEGEKFITGTNFDMNLSTEDKNENETNIKMKENIMESTAFNEEKGLAKLAVTKDIVKFSDELKKKAKRLKPIEFN